MHRCLSIEELLNLVCEELDGFDALPKLARTAKVFQEPALNTLWRRQESMDPLFSVLPSDMFIRDPREQWDVTRVRKSNEARVLRELKALLMTSIYSAAVTTNRLHATTQFVKSWMITSPICEFQAFITGRDEIWSDSPHIPLVALVAERYFDNLTSFVLTSEESFPSNTSAHSNSLSSQDFHPLLLCKKIEIFKIYLPCSLANFDDESLKKMANAWPGLRKITLLPYPQQQPSLCSFQSLVHLTRGCPKLESVSITFSLGQDSSFSIDGGVPNVMGLRLTELHDGLSPLEQTSAPAMASFLRSLAPNLRNVSKEGRYVRVGFYTIEDVNFWAEVNELLNV
ncbi:hypothetical protein HWV62_4427 [Athelia sp. TMB]|nr:hypothetical protein HWV62_4427 [Athelia sp. TMB]